MQDAVTGEAPLVSVIIPCFNAGPMLGPALRSVIGQTHSNLEIIFVDNNSTDASLAVAGRLAAETTRPFQILNCPDQGVNAARNLGYARARGGFIQWLDADDELAPDKIARQVSALEADPDIDIAYGDWAECRMPAGRPPVFRPHMLRQVDDQLGRTLAGVWHPPHVYLLRRAAADRLQSASAWWPGRPVATDVEYSAVAALLGLRFQHTPDARVRYNIWSESQLGSTDYGRRVRTLSAIFSRLRALEPAASVTLRERDRLFLDLDWDLWRMPAGEVTLARLGERRFRLDRGGRVRDLRPREAAVARMLMSAGQPFANWHLALHLVERVPELGGDHALAVRTLLSLQAEGFMDRTGLSPSD